MALRRSISGPVLFLQKKIFLISDLRFLTGPNSRLNLKNPETWRSLSKVRERGKGYHQALYLSIPVQKLTSIHTAGCVYRATHMTVGGGGSDRYGWIGKKVQEWRERFYSDPDLVGAWLLINMTIAIIICVLGFSFKHLFEPENERLTSEEEERLSMVFGLTD
ncbi:uncharacterized protein LOC111706693 [Eurytemora carolleeae]|uniref:uncharacterized protein LOC111706693 n=1 Tax=Eurytemora carolleeae TaxID=1294199 RepID=UPI000C7651E5|nr:uncharacterized protein LOC111706693 [Eurytemora carolleeae]|eukprot:XP_023335377.1 uncharacterized protein LOC111706693 [Eurytemora affinis]